MALVNDIVAPVDDSLPIAGCDHWVNVMLENGPTSGECGVVSDLPVVVSNDDDASNSFAVVSPPVSMQSRLAELGWKAVEKGSRGDCFFRSVCASLERFNYDCSDANALIARHESCEYLCDNWLQYQHVMVAEGVETPEEFMEEMRKPFTWVNGHIEVIAAANAFNVHIHE